ncbi:MAG: DsbE family thiol:disulfide interchange protein [Gammaproteobacteria bacterium]|nr:DsbE family thiol:disulfide interchange protein [Gammaproteobacteria bacterium]
MIGRFLPVIIFVALGLLLAAGLRIADHKSEIPSPLVGKPLPPFELPVLGQPERVLTNEDLVGQPFLLNVWASWCPTCRIEHPFIADLAESGELRVIGFNYKDELDDAQAWLARFGDPYDITLQDYSGRYAIDLGVYAAPESFLVDADGTIIFKQIGAVTPEIIEQEILPRIRK